MRSLRCLWTREIRSSCKLTRSFSTEGYTRWNSRQAKKDFENGQKNNSQSPMDEEEGSYFTLGKKKFQPSQSSTKEDTPVIPRKITTRPTLKHLLRKFYLKVHPDLFEHYAYEKGVNADSFATLNDLLDSIKKGSLSNKSYTLEFYIYIENSETSDNPFRKINVTRQLPFGDTRSRGIRGLIQQDLRTLFGAAGLETNFIWGDEFRQAMGVAEKEERDAKSESQEMDEFSLIEFLRVVWGEAKKVKDSMESWRTITYFKIVTAHMRLQGLRIILETGLMSTDKQTELYFQLQKAMQMTRFSTPTPLPKWNPDLEEEKKREESADPQTPFRNRPSPNVSLILGIMKGKDENEVGVDPESALKRETPRPRSDFSKVVTVLSAEAERSHVDTRGRLVLAVKESAEDWAKFIDGPKVDGTETDSQEKYRYNIIEVCQNRQQEWIKIKTLEKEICEVSGLNDIFSQTQLIGDESYISFLHRLRSKGALFRDLFAQHSKSGLSELPIRIQKPSESDWTVDKTMGYLLVPVTASPEGIINLLKDKGIYAVDVIRQYKKQVEEYKATTLAVKRNLRLGSLEKNPDITNEQMLECCNRLMSCKHSVRYMLYELHIQVGNGYKFDPAEKGVGRITIPWNFL